MSLIQDERFTDALVSLGILAASYVGARFVSFLIGRLLHHATHKTATDLDDQLLSALKRPITYLLFLLGAWYAIARLSTPTAETDRLMTGLSVVGTLIVALASMRAYGILVAWYARTPRFREGDGPILEFGPLFSTLGKLFIFTVATIAILNRLGVNVASLVVSLGVGSLAVGLAAQDTLANMFAGFTLLLDRPFRAGDRIRLASGEQGDIETIGMRATRIKTLDDTVLIVPNSLLVKDRVVNLSRPDRNVTSRVEVGVAYGTDLAAAKRIMADAALASSYVETSREPQVLVTRFADFAVSLVVVFWARDYAEQGLAVSSVYEELDRRFREAGIQIPFPTRTVIQDERPAPEVKPA